MCPCNAAGLQLRKYMLISVHKRLQDYPAAGRVSRGRLCRPNAKSLNCLQPSGPQQAASGLRREVNCSAGTSDSFALQDSAQLLKLQSFMQHSDYSAICGIRTKRNCIKRHELLYEPTVYLFAAAVAPQS